jgi:hypothetical protein
MPEREPEQAPIDESAESAELGDHDIRVDQQNVGVGIERGGGEWPDPDTPPSGEGGGVTGETRMEHGKGQFQEAYDSVPDDVRASGAIGGHMEGADAADE